MSPFTTKYVAIHNTVCRHSQQSLSSFTTKCVTIHNKACRHSQQSVSPFTTKCVAIHNKVCRHSQESMSSFTTKYVVMIECYHFLRTLQQYMGIKTNNNDLLELTTDRIRVWHPTLCVTQSSC